VRTYIVLVSVLCGILLAAFPAVASTLWGLSSSEPGVLYTVDPATGAATEVVTVTGAIDASSTGLEILNGTIYATDVYVGGGVMNFGSIDRATGAFTLINDQAGSLNWQGLAADPVADLLYSVDLNSTDYNLVSITPAGVIAVVGPTGSYIRGMAYGGGTLYGVTDDSLYTIDISTGAATLVGALGLTNSRPGLAYDGNAGVLYLNLGSGDPGYSLYTVDKTTGLATLVGPNGSVAGEGIDGLAWEDTGGPAVPEPSTFALLSIGAGALALRRRLAR
jgi:hypothetical protein